MRSSFFTLVVQFITFIFSFSVFAQSESSNSGINNSFNLKDSYSFQYEDPYFASLTLKILKSPGEEPKTLPLTSFYDRKNVSMPEPVSNVNAYAFIQKEKAPLIYIIPGFGATAYDGGGVYLAEKLYKRGFSTIVVPSPMFWKFALLQSSTGLVGYPPADARDLRTFMYQARLAAERLYKMKVSRSALIGYSLGAINSAFIMGLEKEYPILNIERVVMINPPLRMSVAIKEIDRLYHTGDSWTAQYKQNLWIHVLNIGGKFLSGDISSENYFKDLHQKINLKGHQAQYLIGASFYQTLADTIYVGQKITNLGILDPKGDYKGQIYVASQLGFDGYVDKILFPYWSKKVSANWSKEEFLAKGDLIAMKPIFASDSSYRLLHNLDDYLVDPNDLKEVASAMGARAIIYPLGGHVGNIWKTQNQNDIFNAVKDLL